MLLVFLLLFFVLLCNSLLYLLLCSYVNINIRSLHIQKQEGRKIKIKFKIQISFCLWKKFSWLCINIDEKKVGEWYQKRNFNFRNLPKSALGNKETMKEIRMVPYEIVALYLDGYGGTENAAVTSFFITLANSLVGILLRNKVINDKIDYQITPLYQNQNFFNLKLHCIIRLKNVYIITSIYRLWKKGRVKKYERPSHRRSYAYRYE